MSKQNRDFKTHQIVYLVDYWGTANGTKAFMAKAEIVYVNENRKTFVAVLYGDTYQTYSFYDYGHLIFDTASEATEAANKLPEPQSIVYQKIGKKVYKKTVIGIGSRYVNEIYDLTINLKNGQAVSTKEFGISIFSNELDARK